MKRRRRRPFGHEKSKKNNYYLPRYLLTAYYLLASGDLRPVVTKIFHHDSIIHTCLKHCRSSRFSVRFTGVRVTMSRSFMALLGFVVKVKI